MFSTNSNVKVGHKVEKAWDVYEHTPFDMELHVGVDDSVAIVTDDIDTIVLTPDTRILTARGLWKRVCELQRGEVLKNVIGNKVILNIIRLKSPISMYEVSGTDYVIVNNFYIDK